MSRLEWIATLLGIACVALAGRRSIWTFPVGIVSVVLFGIVVSGARLYSDALLQVFFVAANLYGWRAWSRSRARTGEVAVRRMSGPARWGWGGGIVLATLLWGGAMHRWTDAAWPWWDAAIAAGSVAAQLLMAQRRWESWWLWIAVDIASVPLYLARELLLFAALYLVYLLLATRGAVIWAREMDAGRTPAAA